MTLGRHPTTVERIIRYVSLYPACTEKWIYMHAAAARAATVQSLTWIASDSFLIVVAISLRHHVDVHSRSPVYCMVLYGPLLGRLDGPTPTPVRGQRYPRRRVASLSATPPRRRRVFDVLMECYIADLLHRQSPAASVKPGGVVRATDRCPDICHRLTSVSRTHPSTENYHREHLPDKD